MPRISCLFAASPLSQSDMQRIEWKVRCPLYSRTYLPLIPIAHPKTKYIPVFSLTLLALNSLFSRRAPTPSFNFKRSSPDSYLLTPPYTFDILPSRFLKENPQTVVPFYHMWDY